MGDATGRVLRCWAAPIGCVLLLALGSSAGPVRRLLTAPLVVSEASAAGDAAYVLSGGLALRERIDAAADLYLMQRVPLIILMRDEAIGAYSFRAGTNWTGTEWALDWLRWRGVPDEAVRVVDSQHTSRFGTLDEARSLARTLPGGVRRLVLVSSPPHMRRSLLAFSRSFPSGVVLTPYAATAIETSAEYYNPLWLEYGKLLVYGLVA